MRGISILLKLLLLVTMIIATMVNSVPLNYGDALTKSILFFEGQRSGYLPASQRMTWRKNSALKDGSDIGVRMDGGYYDAGDNVKFHFPMAFTTTMLAWSVIEFGDLMGPDLQHAIEAIRWGTDYFLKATKDPNVVIAQIGDPNSDHGCWERPEDMDTSRKTYVVTTSKPGSEVSAEIAAALAASSIALRKSDGRYSRALLLRAKLVFDFANNHRGSYNDSIGDGACPFYCDFNGYMDELVWGAAWLYKASNDKTYWNFVKSNIQSLGSLSEFGWDSKHAGINVLISEVSRVMNDPSNQNPFILNANNLICSLLPNSPTKAVTYSKGGLLFKPGSSNLQHVTSYSFLLIVYARYMQVNHKTINCGSVVAKPTDLIDLAKSQVNYVLGNNPLGMSYMVGYGLKFPQKIHHRASTMPSIDVYPKHIGCRDGDKYFELQSPNINQLTGAIVGGPAEDDSFQDSRFNVSQSEPTTYINAPFVGVLAYFKQSKS
ncbi:endoglucanase 8-like isoform X2 [Vicia villosa]|uniref:endoglucanase 8-like isoform X2 n=1 Tax=Vicia villosa TaxID=3911 RepID=UPI00273C16A6|nr:endoglucanase 8-like isoform X2 [Vicia villosa]